MKRIFLPFLLTVLAVLVIFRKELISVRARNAGAVYHATRPVSSENKWFNRLKPDCLPEKYAEALKKTPPPPGDEGVGFTAACYALAGKLEAADTLLGKLTSRGQDTAANILFDVFHPAADAGEDQSTLPMMIIVIKYQPYNYMAMYHAGMSQYRLGDLDAAEEHLEAYMQRVPNKDGWTQLAESALVEIRKER